MQEKPKKKLPGVKPDVTAVSTRGYVSPEDEAAAAREKALALLAGKERRLTGVAPDLSARDSDGMPTDLDSPVSREREWYGDRRIPGTRAAVEKSKSRIKNHDEWLKKMFGS